NVIHIPARATAVSVHRMKRQLHRLPGESAQVNGSIRPASTEAGVLRRYRLPCTASDLDLHHTRIAPPIARTKVIPMPEAQARILAGGRNGKCLNAYQPRVHARWII